MDMGKIKKVRRVADPQVAPKIDRPLVAPIFTTPERELVPVPVKREEVKQTA